LPWTGEANDEELLRIEKIIMELLEEKNVCEILKKQYDLRKKFRF
ncbi:hypothetical protein T4C_3864, partial [Trichinella pseudospiralis]